MNTQRNIMLIVMAVVVVALGIVAGLVWWLGLIDGLLVAGAAAIAVLLVYLAIIRPWHLSWGASKREVMAAMPGDELVPKAVVSTRAITIEAGPTEIWPWLVQIGFGRAGWYSYDWIDNDGNPSADRIEGHLQTLDLGDQIEIIPGMGPRVVALEPDRALVAGADDGSSSWCLLLEREGDGTRLISRWRNHFDLTPATAFIVALTDPGAFVMEQKMLRTIRDRVEASMEVAA